MSEALMMCCNGARGSNPPSVFGQLRCSHADLGVDVIILPPGCTGVTQPVNIGYNKPFKNLVRNQ